MPTALLYTDEFLEPISVDQPAGVNLRWTAEWDRLKEARRADDALEPGPWAKKDHKAADWRLVESLASTMLRERSKDLQLALWLTEAGMKLHGFPGLRDGLRLTRELMVRYWDSGLCPPIEDGPEDRVGPFEWLNMKLGDSITNIPITVREDSGPDYSFLELQDARATGSESSYKDADGEIDLLKKRAYEAALAKGHVSLEMFERAVAGCKRAAYEELNSDFQQTCEEFQALEKVIDEKFGDVAPSLSIFRNALQELRRVIEDIVKRKRAEEPDVISNGSPGEEGSLDNSLTFRFPLNLPVNLGASSAGGSWNEAETLIRSGQVEKGLAEMIRLSAAETSGRNRFQRKLLLAEVCLGMKRERLARSILEELAEQIDKFQLEAWESTDLIAAVWTRLYKLYNDGGSDKDRADKLFARLCRLDPWQALNCAGA